MSTYTFSSGTTVIRSQSDLPSGIWMFAFSEGPAALDISSSVFHPAGAQSFFRTIETEGRFGLELASFVLFSDRSAAGSPISITVRLDGSSFNAQGFLFGGFGPEDGFSIIGGNTGETILGATFISNLISGGGGADYLRGGDMGDVFIYDAASDATDDAIETVDGRYGFDSLKIGAALNLSAGELLSIERVEFSGEASSLVLASRQFGAGKLANNLQIVGGDGANTLTINATGAFSADTLSFLNWASEDSLMLAGGAGSDTLTAGTVATVLKGNGGNDTLTGGRADDRLEGGTGDDLLIGAGGADVLDGGEGFDSVSYAQAAAVMVSLVDQANNGGAAAGDRFSNVERFVLSAGDDSFVAFGAAVPDIDAGAGNDTLTIQGGGAFSLDEARLAGFESIVLQDIAGSDVSVSSYAFARLVDARSGSNDVLRLTQSLSATERALLRDQGFEQIFALNRTPTLTAPLAGMSMPEDGQLIFALPQRAFDDADGDTLTLSARLASGAALPDWIRFDGATARFAATPPANFNGSVELEVIASDGKAEAMGRFTLTVSSEPEPPVTVAEVFGQSPKPLPAEDIVTMLDTRMAIEALSAAQFGQLASRNIDAVDAVGDSLFLKVAQFNSLGPVALTASDQVTLFDTGRALSGLMPNELANLALRGVDWLNANDNRLTLSLAQLQALGTVRLTSADVVTVVATAAEFGTLSIAALKGMSSAGVDILDSASNAATLSLVQFNALGRMTFAANDVVTIIGTNGANIMRGQANAEVMVGMRGADQLFGNGGDDRLIGGGGNDLLVGGAGSDSFVFTLPPGRNNVDILLDFGKPDTIVLENRGTGLFDALSAGWLNPAAFKANLTGTATDRDDRILYDTDSGELYFDRDGTGGSMRVQFAVLTNKPIIGADDFFVT